MSCPVQKQRIPLWCPECNNTDDDHILITELQVERIGLLYITIFCDECKKCFVVPYSIKQLIADAEEQDKNDAKDLTRNWLQPRCTKPN